MCESVSPLHYCAYATGCRENRSLLTEQALLLSEGSLSRQQVLSTLCDGLPAAVAQKGGHSWCWPQVMTACCPGLHAGCPPVSSPGAETPAFAFNM